MDEGIAKFNIMASKELKKFSNEIISKIYFDYDLKKSNWFNIGGKTKVYFKPDNLPDLILFLINDQYQLAKFIKHNIYGKKIVVGMGAGTISNWMKKLPKLI